jgi:hypothetical protein
LTDICCRLFTSIHIPVDTTILALSWAKTRVMPLPMPLPEPVTIATFSFNLISLPPSAFPGNASPSHDVQAQAVTSFYLIDSGDILHRF